MHVLKYQKKPVIVEAYQTDKEMDIQTLEGTMHASVGDYIITGVNGEQYPCKPDIFAKTYDICSAVQTKADKIRQMSDEELVEAWYYIYHNVIFNSTDSRQGLLDWLKQEAISDE